MISEGSETGSDEVSLHHLCMILLLLHSFDWKGGDSFITEWKISLTEVNCYIFSNQLSSCRKWNISHALKHKKNVQEEEASVHPEATTHNTAAAQQLTFLHLMLAICLQHYKRIHDVTTQKHKCRCVSVVRRPHTSKCAGLYCATARQRVELTHHIYDAPWAFCLYLSESQREQQEATLLQHKVLINVHISPLCFVCVVSHPAAPWSGTLRQSRFGCCRLPPRSLCWLMLLGRWGCDEFTDEWCRWLWCCEFLWLAMWLVFFKPPFWWATAKEKEEVILSCVWIENELLECGEVTELLHLAVPAQLVMGCGGASWTCWSDFDWSSSWWGLMEGFTEEKHYFTTLNERILCVQMNLNRILKDLNPSIL